MRDHHFFDKWAREQNMRPITKVTDPEGEILIADSGKPFLSDGEYGVNGMVFRTAFCIMRYGAWTASVHDYDASEFYGVSAREGQQTRVNECLEFGRKSMSDCLNVGLYDGRRRISPVLN